MNNLLAALLAIAASALLVVIMLVTYKGPPSGEPITTQTPTFTVREDRMMPKLVYVNAQELVEILVINEGRYPHEIVLEKVDAAGKKLEELRRLPIEPGLAQSMTVRLSAGEYAIYCAIKEGVHVHRARGEEAKIISR
jgi:precorrin-4 methylase